MLDAIIIKPVDVTFDLIWRQSGGTDVSLATWTQHFDPLALSYDAQPFEYDEPCGAITFKDGDQLVFRYTGANTTSQEAYIPNGDGAHAAGRIPHIELP